MIWIIDCTVTISNVVIIIISRFKIDSLMSIYFQWFSINVNYQVSNVLSSYNLFPFLISKHYSEQVNRSQTNDLEQNGVYR